MHLTAFLAAPIHHRGVLAGDIFVGSDEPSWESTREDKETLVIFSSQAALVVSNARRHRDEQRARAELEALIDTSTVAEVVFDVRGGSPVSFNREAERIVGVLRDPEQTTEELPELTTVRRADGQEISREEFPLAQVLSETDTVRAEEIALEVPDGRAITVLLNATPIRTDAGGMESLVVTMQDLTPLEEMERLQSEFLGTVSHELRMPLTSIWGSVMAKMEDTEDLDPAEMRQFLRIILEQVSSVRDPIGDLLDVAPIVDRARNVFRSVGAVSNL